MFVGSSLGGCSAKPNREAEPRSPMYRCTLGQSAPATPGKVTGAKRQVSSSECFVRGVHSECLVPGAMPYPGWLRRRGRTATPAEQVTPRRGRSPKRREVSSFGEAEQVTSIGSRLGCTTEHAEPQSGDHPKLITFTKILICAFFSLPFFTDFYNS